MKALCAIAFALSSFTIPAQAQNCSNTIIEPSTMSAQTIAQIVVTEPTVEATDEVIIIAPNAATETSVEAIAPSDATQVTEHATRSDSKLTDEGIAPSTMPAQIVVAEPTVEELSPADQVMIVAPNAATETSVEAVEPSDATEVAEHATRSDGKLMDEDSERSRTPAQIIATERTVEELSEADRVTKALDRSEETQVAEHATRSDSKLPETIEPSTMPAQTVAAERTVEDPRADNVMIMGPNEVPVEASDVTKGIFDQELIE
jgi:hypothetical protein